MQDLSEGHSVKIFEVGFLTDPSDRNLANAEGREKTAVGLARALQEIHRRG